MFPTSLQALQRQTQTRPRFFCRKSTLFHTRPVVVGGQLRGRNPRKQQKNAINYVCFVTTSMTSAL